MKLFAIFICLSFLERSSSAPRRVRHVHQVNKQVIQHGKQDHALLSISDSDGLLVCSQNQECLSLRDYWVPENTRLQCLDEYLPIAWDSRKENDTESDPSLAYLTSAGTMKGHQKSH